MSTPEFAASFPNAFVPAARPTVPDDTTTAPVLHAVIFPSMDASDAAIASRTALSTADKFAVIAPDDTTTAPVLHAVILLSVDVVRVNIPSRYVTCELCSPLDAAPCGSAVYSAPWEFTWSGA